MDTRPSAMILSLVLISAAFGQITANQGDGVLNAPYRGTVDSLRECTIDIGSGEVQSHVEPLFSTLTITSSWIDVWVEGTWDRSVLRLFSGLDASESEIDLTCTTEFCPETLTVTGDFMRFSLKAIGTKTLATQTFTIGFAYNLRGTFTTVTRTFKVAPITGSFCSLPGESEAFHLGTPLLDIVAGNARLTVPVGRTATMIGATFEYKDKQLGPSAIQTTDVLLPGAAETVYIQNFGQFRLGGGTTGPNKLDWGTPWPGYLIGYYNSGDTFGPDGTHFDSLAMPSIDGLRRFDKIRPLMLADTHLARVDYSYDGSNRVTKIADHDSPPNEINLIRTAGVVTRITTSDGRGWDITSSSGLITAILPDSGKGERFFSYNPAGRITEVKACPDIGACTDPMNRELLYAFTYANDSKGVPTVLTAEKRFVDGALQTVREHQIVSAGLSRRKDYQGPNAFRQTDFTYNSAGGFQHTLTSIKTYSGLNGTGTPFTTTFVPDYNNSRGNVVITQTILPDGGVIQHQYDAHSDPAPGGGSVSAGEMGLVTKKTYVGAGAPASLDVTYELFYPSGAITRLFHRPRIIKQRDGRGALSEVTFDFEEGGTDENGDGIEGQELNQLLSRSGPTINLGPSDQRTPRTDYIYDCDPSDNDCDDNRVLERQETDYASGMFRTIGFQYDALLRLTARTIDPDAGGENLTTQYLFCDSNSTQDRITVDPDGYWHRVQFDSDGRPAADEQYLNASAGTISQPCTAPTGPVYRTTRTYDVKGRLTQVNVENKDQDGTFLSPSTITTNFAYDRIGRLTLGALELGANVDREHHSDYNWLGDIERRLDTSGRGVIREYDGRGLVCEESPIAVEPELALTITFQYDTVGRLSLTTRPTGGQEDRDYDPFGRLDCVNRIPVPAGGNTISTCYDYDAANNTTRTTVDENGVLLADSVERFDEGNFNYESRQRVGGTGVDGPTDPVTERIFDWSGNVTEEKSVGDATVADSVRTLVYDGASRLEVTSDSEGGQTTFLRDGRGNITDAITVLSGTTSATTTTEYDALNRATKFVDPEDSDVGGLRHYRKSDFDSRGNLLRETAYHAGGNALMRTVFSYDTAGRQVRQALLSVPSSTVNAAGASVTTDRVTALLYDPDGRLKKRTVYNNNSSAPITTILGYDPLGHLKRVDEPSGTFMEEAYFPNGLLESRTRFNGVDAHVYSYLYDGHDRVTSEAAEGPPVLVTSFALDGLDRIVQQTDPKGMTTKTEYDRIGRRTKLIEDFGTGLAVNRTTEFAYNTLNQMIEQRAENKASSGTELPDQVTTMRYDSLGRMTRTVFPDAAPAVHANPTACSGNDCWKMIYDSAGRLTQRADQRPVTTNYVYDDRSLVLTRTTGTVKDTLFHDPLGRPTIAERGVSGNLDAESFSLRAYTTNGDLDYEQQGIKDLTPRTVDYSYDQAGNRLHLTYPSSVGIDYAPTVTNQVDSMELNSADLVDYQYSGLQLDRRITTTSTPGTTYTCEFAYDAHRRTDTINNIVDTNSSAPETIAAYSFLLDNNGNPLVQTVTDGMTPFLADDRIFSVDRLNRLLGTEYLENGQIESSVFDLVGNRETHTNRAAQATQYGVANAANEYPAPFAYDAAGNLSTDEDGRQYFYDEVNRLTQVKSAGSTVLANYSYDAVGRRVLFEDPVATRTIRYYYDGPTVIEERNAADVRTRYHVNGAQYVDENVATYNDATSSFDYYLLNRSFSVAGTGNAAGTSFKRFDYSSTGDFAGGGGGAGAYYHDFDNELDIDLRDFGDFLACFGQTSGCTVHNSVAPSAINLADYARLRDCTNGPFTTPDQLCAQSGPGPSQPESGTFTLHGRPIDVLSDGLTLLYVRARYYDLKNGRWLERDPVLYSDGSNLYEAFRGNASANVDPTGEGVLTFFADQDFSQSDIEYLKGFFTGAGQTIKGGAVEFGRIFTGNSAAQRKLVNLVDAEAAYGGTENSTLIAFRASRQGIADFFGATDIAVFATGEDIVFEGGGAFVEARDDFERLQSFVGGVSKFSSTVGGLGGGGGGLGRIQIASSRAMLRAADFGLRRTAEVLPSTQTARVFIVRGGLAIGRAEFALDTPLVAARAGTLLSQGGRLIAVDESGLRVLFGQARISPTFGVRGRPSFVRNRPVVDVARDLDLGILSEADLPIAVFMFEGQLVSVNTRSLAALSIAGRRPGSATLIPATRELLGRLREQPILLDALLPGPRLPITRKLEVLDVIEIPGG